MNSQLKPLRPDDVKWIVVHCSGSRCNHPFTVERLIATGRERFGQPSYHYYVRRNGTVVPILPESVRGVHASSYNSCSIAVCNEGGLDEKGIADDTRSALQRHALYELLKQLRQDYPKARIVGHCELPGTTKPCPCYLPSQEYKDLQPH
jgi:N-acetyl-anhydromuramyl-L-alanine amidase AmpD